MFRNLIAFPLLVLIVIIQTTVATRITLLAGHADLMLIVLSAWALKAEPTNAWLWAISGSAMISFVSEMPWLVFLTGYSFVVLVAQALRQRVWQAPFLAMLGVVLVGSLMMDTFALLVLNLLGRSLPFSESFGLIILPNVLLNLLFTIPVYIIIRDLAKWVHQTQEIE